MHAPTPRLYLSYGMPKSGSTLAFELVRTLLEVAGHPQAPLPPALVDPKHGINFIRELDSATLEAALEAVPDTGALLAIKTHSRIPANARSLLACGRIIGHAVCRDPRDIALSMLDAARDGRAWGKGPEGPYRHVRDTIPRIRSQVNHFLAWASSPHILPLHYEQIAYNTGATAARIADQLGLSVDLPRVLEIVARERFTQKNRALPQRWKSEMSPEDANLLADEFGDFIRNHCSDIPDSPIHFGGKKRLFSFLKRPGTSASGE